MILITAFGDEGTHARAEKAGAAAVLDKPFGIDQLLAKLHEIVPPLPSRREKRVELGETPERRI
jgi:DNA-binding response OmpR family regulator